MARPWDTCYRGADGTFGIVATRTPELAGRIAVGYAVHSEENIRRLLLALDEMVGEGQIAISDVGGNPAHASRGPSTRR
jgi:hypothetical protein